MENPQENKPAGMHFPKLPVEKVKNMEVRHDDVFLLTFPKSGTHWLMEVVPLILNGGNTKDPISIEKKGLPIEIILAGEGDDPRILLLKKNNGAPVDFNVTEIESPRFLGSHVPYNGLPTQLHEKKPKVIYLARNPKDVAVSMLNQMARPPFNVPNDFSLFLEKIFTDGKAMGGEWGSHVLDWWKRRDEDHVLYLKYEDLKKDLKAGVQAIANHLGKDLSPETVEKIAAHCSIDNMKKSATEDPFVKAMGWKDNPFVRKGTVGGWKEKFTVAQSEMMDKYYEHWLKGSGLEFDFE